ncbi:hypothetical protein HRI_002054600 [Hibiscus trionum]|uniref:RING-type E3 ubiquitin transferase n=1 Tax=Hibiscus trionum TaxID=183268 RepID=A0A9W7M166_HIBTR|nr:hypothetical protein HRI_002054600 [Hibiscus trionum]
MRTQEDNNYRERRESKNTNAGFVAVAVDKDKNSQHALKWATDHLLQKGQTIILIHVKAKPYNSTLPRLNQFVESNGGLPFVCKDPDLKTREVFLPFRCFCTRKDIQCKDVVLEETDVAKALIEYVTRAAIEVLVIGASTRSSSLKYKAPDITGTISKNAPDFCSVYVTSKNKISSMRSASRPPPPISPLRNQLLNQSNIKPTPPPAAEKLRPEPPRKSTDSMDCIRQLAYFVGLFLILQKNKEFKKFKKQECEDYELLGEKFNTATATEKLQQLSTEDPLSPDEERRLEEEFLSGSIHVELEGNSSKDPSSKKGKKHKLDSIFRKRRSNKMNKMELFLDKWASTLSAKEEAAKAKAERYKLSISDLYSIRICVELLEKMECVSSRSYNKAIEKFTSTEWRQIFVEMSDARRKDWVDSLD